MPVVNRAKQWEHSVNQSGLWWWWSKSFLCFYHRNWVSVFIPTIGNIARKNSQLFVLKSSQVWKVISTVFRIKMSGSNTWFCRNIPWLAFSTSQSNSEICNTRSFTLESTCRTTEVHLPGWLMDLVEDFLVLSNHVTWLHLQAVAGAKKLYQQGSMFCSTFWKTEVSVTTLIKFLRVLRKRVPGRHLPILGLNVCQVKHPIEHIQTPICWSKEEPQRPSINRRLGHQKPWTTVLEMASTTTMAINDATTNAVP